MKAVPGTLQSGGASFATTRWSVVAGCGADDAAENADAAITQLCRDYWPPLYSFVRRRGYSSADAQDLVQGFFGHLLRKKIYARTNSAKGKFRTFLLTALKNYLADHREKERAEKRGGGSELLLLDEEILAAELSSVAQPALAMMDEEQHYEQRWATALVSRALAQLEENCRASSKAEIFRELKPFLSGGAGLPKQEEVAQRLAMPIDTLRSHISRLRAQYRDLLREEVARTIGFADDVDEELRQLSRILIATA